MHSNNSFPMVVVPFSAHYRTSKSPDSRYCLPKLVRNTVFNTRCILIGR
jgi:hypothetical protein